MLYTPFLDIVMLGSHYEGYKYIFRQEIDTRDDSQAQEDQSVYVVVIMSHISQRIECACFLHI